MTRPSTANGISPSQTPTPVASHSVGVSETLPTVAPAMNTRISAGRVTSIDTTALAIR